MSCMVGVQTWSALGRLSAAGKDLSELGVLKSDKASSKSGDFATRRKMIKIETKEP